MIRHEYLVSRKTYQPSGRALPADISVRVPTADDRQQLAALMKDAYAGTAEHGGATLAQSLADIDRYLARGAMLGWSQVAVAEESIVAAALMSRIVGVPVVAQAMTRAALKGRGIASALVDLAAAAVWDSGHDELRAFIAAGNLPSETLFGRAGFVAIATYED